ncbi:ATP-binding protein [Streptomyces sp. NPDC087428]|uniref:ATP-binding protein n=1 Tax=Streptomyces sp. NPDC087428 TaxID=3365788 RepID=UPI0037F1B54E
MSCPSLQRIPADVDLLGAAMTTPNEVTFRLTRCRSSVPRARAMLRAKLGEWRASQAASEEGELILSELVTNAVRVPAPGDRMVGVRIECRGRGELLRLEVSDAGAGHPEVQRPGELDKGGRGLLLVEALAHRWGVDERPAGIGKTVWAELLAPGVKTAPAETQVAAVSVRPGQCVRMWGAWHTVRAVRSERYASGGPAVIVVLDDGGPAVRLHAAELLTVRKAPVADQRIPAPTGSVVST